MSGERKQARKLVVVRRADLLQKSAGQPTPARDAVATSAPPSASGPARRVCSVRSSSSIKVSVHACASAAVSTGASHGGAGSASDAVDHVYLVTGNGDGRSYGILAPCSQLDPDDRARLAHLDAAERSIARSTALALVAGGAWSKHTGGELPVGVCVSAVYYL